MNTIWYYMVKESLVSEYDGILVPMMRKDSNSVENQLVLTLFQSVPHELYLLNEELYSNHPEIFNDNKYTRYHLYSLNEDSIDFSHYMMEPIFLETYYLRMSIITAVDPSSFEFITSHRNKEMEYVKDFQQLPWKYEGCYGLCHTYLLQRLQIPESFPIYIQYMIASLCLQDNGGYATQRLQQLYTYNSIQHNFTDDKLAGILSYLIHSFSYGDGFDINVHGIPYYNSMAWFQKQLKTPFLNNQPDMCYSSEFCMLYENTEEVEEVEEV